MNPILSFLAAERGIDLRDYRPETVTSRLSGRMQALGCRGAADYLERLRREPAEVDRLVDALLVKVTSFFREPETLDQLQALIASTRMPRPPRAWVIGSATGEEAWSLAMLLDEARDEGAPPWDVLATDIDAGALETAARGVYPEVSAERIPRRLAERYVVRRNGSVTFTDELRRTVRFASHDLMGPRLAPPEAVVASFALILCRNVLIYFTRRLQEKAGHRLAAGLAPGGLLVLGIADSIPESALGPLRPVSPGSCIYRLEAPR